MSAAGLQHIFLSSFDPPEAETEVQTSSLFMFTNAKNVHISGQPHFIYNDNRYISGSGAESLDEGIRLLLSRVVREAMHNSAERFDAPTCHPETRTALQDDILGWADELVDDLNEIVTWMYGPAGAGKSAIAQTIAEKLHDRGQLSASFFFSRGSGGEGRGAETDLVATLAYQLSQTIPTTKPYIATNVRDNPLIFDLGLQDQVNTLIVAPLTAISHTSSGTEKPRVIVVDGLDECRQEKDAQRRVVTALISGLRQIPGHSHKLFITSRPEHQIISIFNNIEAKILRRMELDNKWKPDDDIRTFLLSGFADIRRSHYYFQIHPADKTWPSDEDLRILVNKASGQFIYPSVVLKYIKSEENYSPATRLKAILNIENNEDRPYAELDALYIHIFSQIRGVESVLAILSLIRVHSACVSYTDAQPPLNTFLSEALGLDVGMIGFWLRPLSSLLVWSEQRRIFYKHASLLDFLRDETRSGNFYINSPSTVVVPLVSRVIKWFEDGTAWENLKSGTFLLWIPAFYASILSPDHKPKVWTLLSNFNVVETVLCKQGIEFNDGVLLGVPEYLDWIVAESQNEAYPSAASYLSKPVAQILTWIINQLEFLNVESPDIEQIDLWPFFMIRNRLSTVTTEMISREYPLILEIFGRPHPLGATASVPHLNQMVLMCCLLPHLRFFYRSDLIGHHAMTAQRFGVALKRTAYYLLRLPEHTLIELLDHSPSSIRHSIPPILRLIANVLATLYDGSPSTPDLFFLVALLCPVMVALQLQEDVEYYHVSRYIKRVVKDFPFLTDPMSEDYIQASVTLKDALISSRIRTHLHKVAERKPLTWLLEEKLSYRSLLDTFVAVDIRLSEAGDRVEVV